MGYSAIPTTRSGGGLIPTKTTAAPTPKPAIIPTVPKVVAVAPAPAPAPVASNAEQIAALQAQAAAQYAKVGSWSDPTIAALHNQVVALQAGTGNAYNPTTGAWAPTTVTPATVVPPVVPVAPVVAPPTALQQMMDLIAAQQQIAPPVYQQPNYSLIPQAQKGMAATANAADTTYLPTSHYNDRVASQKEAINTQANQAYNANLGSYNASQNAQQNQLANMASLLPYTEMTASQKATIEQGKIEAELSRQIQAQKDTSAAAADAEQKRQFDLTYGLQKQTADYNTSKPYFAPSSGGGGGSSGGGSASAGTQADRDRAIYGDAFGGVANALGALGQGYGTQAYADKYSTESGVLAPIQVIEQQINEQAGQLRSAGVDPQKLLDDAYRAQYGMDRESYWNQFKAVE